MTSPSWVRGAPPLVSRATLARSLARAYSSLPSTRWTTNGNGVSSSTVMETSSLSLPDAKLSNFNTPHGHTGVVTGRQSIYESAVHHFGIKHNRGSASVGGHTGGGQRHWRPKKNDRDRSTLTAGNCSRVHNSRRSIPGKMWMSTNQIRAIPARAHVSRELRARAPGHLRVYKEGLVAYRAIRVRVS